MEKIDFEFKKIFLDEAIGFLEEIESVFIQIEKAVNQKEGINTLFRLMHNLKGSSKSVGYSELSDFCHAFEDILSLLKNDEITLNSQIVTTLLKAVDILYEFIQTLRNDINYKINNHVGIKMLHELKDSFVCNSHSTLPTPSNHETTSDDLFFDQALFEAITENQIVNNGNVTTKSNTDSNSNSNETLKSKIENSITKNINSVSNLKNNDDESLRISVHKLDSLLNFVGEIVVQKSILEQKLKSEELILEQLLPHFTYFNKLIQEIQMISMSLRMVPIKPLFKRLNRTCRDIATSQGKTIEYITSGEEVELDKVILDKIIDPLIHIVRNAVDHGIESDHEKKENNKNVTSQIKISAIQADNVVKILIQDNGKGLNKNKILAKAKKLNMLKSTKNLTEKEIHSLIFLPGFSTKEEVSDISGRGVGMDIVLKSVEDLKGSIEIDSKEGHGSLFTISIPLSHAILPSLVVVVDNNNFIIPLPHIVETLQLKTSNVHIINENERVLSLRGEVIPLYNLKSILENSVFTYSKEKTNINNQLKSINSNSISKSQSSSIENRNKNGIIVQFDNKKYCFELDEIFGQQEVVIKKIGKEIGHLNGVIGAGIIGRGEVSLILNLKEFTNSQKINSIFNAA